MKKIKPFLVAIFLFTGLGDPCAYSQVNAQQPQVSFEGFRMEDAVINVAATAGKAVVSISSEHITHIPASSRNFSAPFGGGSPYAQDDPFRRFFEDFFGEAPGREYRQMGLGSGVIIDAEGYILTNEHVISGADKITVTLSDGREFKGEVKGSDPRSDLAVVKIDARELPVAQLGDSEGLKIGQWVVAIGNPFGFAMQNPEPTVTAGVISALHRSLGRTIAQDKDYNDLIQTDAAINPGNSGGPLVNLKGEIIGINVAIFSTSGGYQGIGFAIPVNNAKRIISRLREGKKIAYGWLGVTIQNLNQELIDYFKLSGKTGVLVAHVLKGSPAEKGGIKEGDVITEIDGKTINTVRDLLNNVGKIEVGNKIKLFVTRDGKKQLLEMAVGARPEQITEEEPSSAGSTEAVENWRGIKAGELNNNLSQRYNIEITEGVVVTEVNPDSTAGVSGLAPGDVIIEINKQRIKNLSGYQKVISSIKGNALVRTPRGYFIVKEN